MRLCCILKQYTVTQSQRGSANQPVSQSASQPASQSASQSVSQPVSQSVSQPASQSVSQPVCQPVSQPASQPACLPASQSARQQVRTGISIGKHRIVVPGSAGLWFSSVLSLQCSGVVWEESAEMSLHHHQSADDGFRVSRIRGFHVSHTTQTRFSHTR